MREILFRAKRIDNGEWVEGYLFDNGFDGEEKKYFVGGLIIEKYNGTACDEWDITGIDFCEINPENLCQFTGLCDKNGKRIWENDVVWLVCDGEEHIYQIVWDNSELDFKATKGEENYGTNYEYLLCCDEIEVIGNIFDNKELLQEESNE